MKKPEKMVGRMFDGDGAWEEGYNQACDDWEKYHEWYIKTHCVRKEDLPDAEEIARLIDAYYTYSGCGKDGEISELARDIAKRIGVEV